MNGNNSQTDFDVIILGLGPVGALATLFLAEAGLRVAAIERDTEVYRLPRAVNLDGEVIRALQRVGRAEAVDALMQKVREDEKVGFTNSRREFLFGNTPSATSANGWQPMNFFDQPELEGYLRDEVLALEGVKTYIGYEGTDLTQQDDAVTIRVSPVQNPSAQQTTLSSRYLVACDGAASSTRRALNIEWENLGYDQHWLVVDIIAKEGHALNHSTVQVCDPDRLSTYVCTKDPYRRWEFRMNEGETPEQMLKDSTIQSLIDPWTPAGTYEIRRAAVYQFHAATAAEWRVGNIFIAGDAAHQTPPFLGQGMNTGMRDVINLSWKLPLVLDGIAHGALLDTYHAERDAHARDLVEWAVAIGRLMEHLADVERAEREGNPPPATPQALQSSGYGQGREQPPIRDGALILEQVSDDGSTGYLFSQPTVVDAEGTTHRLDQLMGTGFALVALSETDLRISPQSQAILDQLAVKIVTLEALEAKQGHFDRLFKQHRAAIVRPDRIVFGHTTDALDLDTLIAHLGDKLSLLTP